MKCKKSSQRGLGGESPSSGVESAEGRHKALTSDAGAECTGILVPVYRCAQHGNVDGQHVEDIDMENDKIYEWGACPRCGRAVDPVMENGLPVMRELSAEELFWEQWMADPDCEDEDWG